MPSTAPACADPQGGPATRTAREIRELEKGTRRQQREDSRRPVVVTPNGLSRTVAVPKAPKPPKAAKRSLLRRIRPA